MTATYFRQGFNLRVGQWGGQCSNYAANYAFDWNDPVAGRGWGPCNGKAMVDFLVNKKGWQRIDHPVDGAIFSTLSGQYGHTGIITGDGKGAVTGRIDSNWGSPAETIHTWGNVMGDVFCVNPAWKVEHNQAPAPAPAPAPAQVPNDGFTYVVKAGDTLGQIILDSGLYVGRTLWGNGGSVEEVARKNGIADPNKIYVGQKIVL